MRKSATILNEASSYIYTLGNDIYTAGKTPQQTFICSE